MEANPGGSFFTGDTVTAIVRFSESIDFTGTPQLTLGIDSGNKLANCGGYFIAGVENRLPAYLACTYTVVAADRDENGISIPANALSLNGGTITKDGDDTVAAVLTHNAVLASASHRVNPPIPRVTSIPTFLSPSNGIYRTGDAISVTLGFSEAIAVTGTPQLPLTFDGAGSDVTQQASCQRATLSLFNDTVLDCRYTVASDDRDDNGFEVAANSLSLNGGTITKKDDSTVNARLVHSALNAGGGHKVSFVPPLSKPRDLTLTAGDTRIDARWNAPAWDGGSAITGY